MLALIAGTGDLPPALLARLPQRPLICAMSGFVPAITPDLTFRIEQLGSFLQTLKSRNVQEVCMAGTVRRPDIDPSAIDAATLPFVPRIQAALAAGDDGALRAVIGIFEGAGLAVRAAHEIAPDLLPAAGIPTRALAVADVQADAILAEKVLADMGQADRGQACIVQAGTVLAQEGVGGTDAMIADAGDAPGAVLFKGPKPGQDRRADLPVIGPETVLRAVRAQLSGIIIEAGGVMVLDPTKVIATLDAAGLFLWVRPKGDT